MSALIQRNVWVGLALTVAVSFVAIAQANEPAALHLNSALPDGNGGFSGWTAQAPFSRKQTVELELGESLEGTVLSLEGLGAEDSHRVSLQFETSLTIGDEGPHVDLLDWKHCISEWKVLPKRLQGGFELPAPREEEATCFPAAKPHEIEAAVRSELIEWGLVPEEMEHWLGLASKVGAPGEAPSSVGVSKIRLRIEQRIKGQWSEVTLIEFVLPLGC